jgi:hypothetical protein
VANKLRTERPTRHGHKLLAQQLQIVRSTFYTFVLDSKAVPSLFPAKQCTKQELLNKSTCGE